MLNRKKVLTVLVVIVVILYFSSYATDVYCKNVKLKQKSQIFTMTHPQSNEVIFGKSCMICGITKHKDVALKVLIYDKHLKKFVVYNDLNGLNTWNVGSSGIIMKEVQFPQEGTNKLKILCYKKRNQKSIQTNNCQITVLNKCFKNIIKTGYKYNTDNLRHVKYTLRGH